MFFLATADAARPAGRFLQRRDARLRTDRRRSDARLSRTTTATACSRAWATSWSTRTWACCLSTSSTRTGCGSAARRRSRPTTLAGRVPRRATDSASARRANFPELPALHPPHAARRALGLRAAARSANPPSPIGSGWTCSATRCRTSGQPLRKQVNARVRSRLAPSSQPTRALQWRMREVAHEHTGRRAGARRIGRRA